MRIVSIFFSTILGFYICCALSFSFVGLFSSFVSFAFFLVYLETNPPLSFLLVMCGKWETYPREFAKCRRCRKAKYCGKECQSTAWSEGHRFWCSAKDVEEDTLGDHSQSNQTSASTTNAVNTPSTETSAASIHIAVEGGGADVRVPVHTTQRPERTERERERRRASRYDGDSDTGTVRTSNHPHRPPMIPPLPPSSAGGSSTTSYVNPTTSTSTTARAESSMSRDRTIQPHHVQATATSRARTREPAMPTTARSQHQYQHSMQDPTNVNYLTFHVQSAGGQNPEAGRRRAETITTNSALGAGSSSSSASMAASMSRSGTARTVTPVEVPPNVIPPRPPPTTMTTTTTGSRVSVSPTTTNPDWPMAGSPAAGPSRRHHHHHQAHAHPHPHHQRISNVNSARPQASEEDQDDMVLG